MAKKKPAPPKQTKRTENKIEGLTKAVKDAMDKMREENKEHQHKEYGNAS